jgi:hypothetical protein
MLLLQQE